MNNAQTAAAIAAVDAFLDRTAPQLETKAAAPRAPTLPAQPADPIERLAGVIERQNTLLETRGSPRAPGAVSAHEGATRVTNVVVRTPAEARSRTQKARALNELRATSEQNTRRRDVLLEERQGRINADMDRHDADELSRLQRENAELRRKAARPPAQRQALPGLGGQQQVNAAFALYKKAASHYLRTGQEVFGGRHMRELQDACIKLDAKAFNATVSGEGGIFVEPEIEQGVERLLANLSPMRQLATVRTISSASYKKRINTRGGTARWVGETTAPSTDATPNYVELEFPAMTLLAEPQLTQEALEDASIDVEAELNDNAQYDFAEQESAAYISGDGILKPVGLVSAGHTYIANASWAWGKVGYLATAADGAFNGTGPADPIVKLPHELKQAFRQNASWLMNRGTIGATRVLRDGQGRYLWSEGDVSKGVPNTLNGYVVHEDEQMPNIGSNAHAIAFGDWMRAYIIVDRVGFMVLRNPYKDPPYVTFHMRKRVGGGVQRYDAYKTIKFGSS